MDQTAAAARELDVAVRAGRLDLGAVAHEVGASAAVAGAPLREVLDLVERVYRGEPDHAVVRAASLAWAEVALGRVHDAGCEDPLTALTSVPHLHTRLVDVLREAAATGRVATHGYVLVVLELAGRPSGASLESSLEAIEVGDLLRTVFPGEEVLARTAAARFAVLTRRERADATALALVRALLRRSSLGDPPPRLWVEELPASADDLPWLLEALGR